MAEAIFIFQDDETEMAVTVRDCDHVSAMSMLHKTLTSPIATPLRDFDALEFASLFVSVNKKKPYDILFCGAVEEDDELSDVEQVYDCHSNGDSLVVTPMNYNNKQGCAEPEHLWALKQIRLH